MPRRLPKPEITSLNTVFIPINDLTEDENGYVLLTDTDESTEDGSEYEEVEEDEEDEDSEDE
ncbi:MAG: hypothetical protein ACRDL7_12775, partial [Gaiellaceae bacterium]